MRYKAQVFVYSMLLSIPVLMTPVTSYQEEFDTIENTEPTPIEKTNYGNRRKFN